MLCYNCNLTGNITLVIEKKVVLRSEIIVSESYSFIVRA